MNQEIVTFIQNYPVIFIILCTVAGFTGGFAFYRWITWMLAPRTRWSMFGQSMKKPEPSESYKSNVATGIKDLPKIDLYNLQNTGMQSIDNFARRIADKWEGSLKHKRPAVLRGRMNTIAGQILAGLLADNGIPVEPKRKP